MKAGLTITITVIQRLIVFWVVHPCGRKDAQRRRRCVVWVVWGVRCNDAGEGEFL